MNALFNSRFVESREFEGEICYSIHREIQRALRQIHYGERKHDMLFNQAVKILRREFPEPSPIQAPEENKWEAYKRLLPHVSSLRELYVTENNRMPGTFHGTRDFVSILSEAGINQWDQGMNREGLEMVLAAETVLEKDLKDNDSSQRADVHVAIALMMERGIGERRDALERRMSVLKLRRGFAAGGPISREEEIKLYNSYSDLAFSLLEYNDSIQAEELFKICYKKYCQWENESYHDIHWEWVKYFNAMASIRMLQGNYPEAERKAHEAMILAGQMGNKSGSLKWKFLFGTILLQKGDIEGALRVHQEVRDERIERAGVMNELTLESFYAVAAIREIQGRWDDAE
jgi:tetratricopeptide (TPR) repeat protein